MKTKDYNIYIETIKYAHTIKDSEERKKTLLAIKTRLIADYGLNDVDAQNLVNKC